MSAIEHRVIRIPLPLHLIRGIDRLIQAGTGGYATRAEFIVDAIEERLIELTVPAASVDPEPSSGNQSDTPVALATLPPQVSALDGPAPWDNGRINYSPSVFVIAQEELTGTPEGKGLFGLHNRDYPSLWALAELAAMTIDGAIEVETYYERILRLAWDQGRRLLDLESRIGRKCTALFPTNTEKRKSAEAGFRAFAVGDFRVRSDGAIVTFGPLFEWYVASLVHGKSGRLCIATTAVGRELLEALSGLDVIEPHRGAGVFLAHLDAYAPGDFAGFAEVLSAIGREGATRDDVMKHFEKQWPDWSPNEISTNSAGYVARAREWGLVEPKQTNGLYRLTEFGFNSLPNGRTNK